MESLCCVNSPTSRPSGCLFPTGHISYNIPLDLGEERQTSGILSVAVLNPAFWWRGTLHDCVIASPHVHGLGISQARALSGVTLSGRPTPHAHEHLLMLWR